MVTSTVNRTLAIVAIVILLAIGTSDPQFVHIYRINDEPGFTSVCSDTATLVEIEKFVERDYAEFGDSDGYDMTQPGLTCALYNH